MTYVSPRRKQVPQEAIGYHKIKEFGRKGGRGLEPGKNRHFKKGFTQGEYQPNIKISRTLILILSW